MYCQGLETVAIGSGESSFGWEQCDSCGSTLGGDRFPASGLYRPEDGADLESIEMTVCVDCVMFHANGDIPETWEG